MEETKYKANIEGNLLGLVQDSYPNVTYHFTRMSSIATTTSYQGIISMPPPRDAGSIQQPIALVEIIHGLCSPIQMKYTIVALRGW